GAARAGPRPAAVAVPVLPALRRVRVPGAGVPGAARLEGTDPTRVALASRGSLGRRDPPGRGTGTGMADARLIPSGRGAGGLAPRAVRGGHAQGRGPAVLPAGVRGDEPDPALAARVDRGAAAVGPAGPRARPRGVGRREASGRRARHGDGARR